MARRILVIDDSSDLRDMLKIFLEMEGFVVTLARDGIEALKQLREQAPPCLILLDMIMERMDGKTFLDRLRVEQPQISEATPIIAMSALDSLPNVDVCDFITKPFDMDSLTSAVYRHCQADASA